MVKTRTFADPLTEISASTVKNSGRFKASARQPSFSSNSRTRISAAPSLLNMHLPFSTSTIELTICSVFFKAFNPSSNLERRPRTAREVPERSSPSLLSTTWINTGIAPARTARVQLPWNCTSSAKVLSR
ncbi:hypothetical protein ES288_D05G051900v1 [Gossypium darwinii]|uniref:Uncharacterized protein n=1 Tax=Gossypium darwinii TaxID=34276 RepID=A0A5D2CC01_GOSDA|nr:hypothetical protein ES288_D05G051900v1 [Gossypium darwinii]